MESDMTATSSLAGLHRGWFVRKKGNFLGIEPKYGNLVASLVGHDKKTSGGIVGNLMGLNALLLRLVRTRLPGNGDLRRQRRKAPISLDRKGTQASGRIVRDEHESIGLVRCEVNRIGSATILFVQEGDLACLGIDRVGTRLPKITMHRIEISARAIEGQIRRIYDVPEQLNLAPFAGARVDAIDPGALAARVAP